MRRDRLGRRIGRNWWRELVCDHLGCAAAAWELEAEAASRGWATELEEYRQLHPRPQLKVFLVGLSGTRP